MEVTYGIDVSEHNGVINWSLVKAAGVKFAFIRAVEGIHIDTEYVRNVEGATMAGIDHGAYGYYYPKLDPEKYAWLFMDTIRPYPHTILPAGDLEEKTPYKMAENLRRWNLYMSILDSSQRGKCWNYISAGYWNSHMSRQVYDRYTTDAEMVLMDHPLWQPAYRQGFPDQFFPWLKWDIWQFTSAGRIPGIVGKVDLNRSFLTVEEIRMKGRPNV